jgi:hypothetical protein
MNKLLLAALFACCTSASATVLTFDDLNGNLSPVPDGYGGFLWNIDTSVGVANGVQQAASNPGAPGFATGVVSAPNVAFNFAGGNPTSIGRANGTFTFDRAFFTSSSGTQQLSFSGLAGGNVVFNSGAYTITQAAPLLISLNWSGIDTLQINTDMDGNPPWVMDDFTFTATAGGTGAVPEPFSLSLMGLGLAALGVARRKKG